MSFNLYLHYVHLQLTSTNHHRSGEAIAGCEWQALCEAATGGGTSDCIQIDDSFLEEP